MQQDIHQTYFGREHHHPLIDRPRQKSTKFVLSYIISKTVHSNVHIALY